MTMKYNLEDKILLKLSLNLQMHTDSWSLIGMGIEGRDCKDIIEKKRLSRLFLTYRNLAVSNGVQEWSNDRRLSRYDY